MEKPTFALRSRAGEGIVRRTGGRFWRLASSERSSNRSLRQRQDTLVYFRVHARPRSS